MTKFHSLLELCAGRPLPWDIGGVLEIDRRDAIPLRLDHVAAEDADKRLQTPRDRIERQVLVITRNRLLGTEAIFNPLRSKRSAVPGRLGQRVESAEIGSIPCEFCDGQMWSIDHPQRAEDDFGSILHQGVLARPNWARSSELSGLIHGGTAMHDLLPLLDRKDFVLLFEAADEYVRKARTFDPGLTSVCVFCNGGFKSAGSVAHAHLQVIGRRGRAFPAVERLCGIPNTLTRTWEAHEKLGLACDISKCKAFVDLVPVKERAFTVYSPDLVSGAQVVRDFVRKLRDHGTRNFSLAAILVPDEFRPRADDPGVVWRFADRGNPDAKHGDIGSMELLLGVSVVASDPYQVADILFQ